MASKVLVSGKHALTVRINQEDYRVLSLIGAEKNMTVNEMLAKSAEKMAKEYEGKK